MRNPLVHTPADVIAADEDCLTVNVHAPLWDDNITGLKHTTEAVECISLRGSVLVEERSHSSEARSKELVEW